MVSKLFFTRESQVALLAVWIYVNVFLFSCCSGDALALPRVQCPNHPEAILVEDYRAGDMICPECGLVVGECVTQQKLFLFNHTAISVRTHPSFPFWFPVLVSLPRLTQLNSRDNQLITRVCAHTSFSAHIVLNLFEWFFFRSSHLQLFCMRTSAELTTQTRQQFPKCEAEMWKRRQQYINFSVMSFKHAGLCCRVLFTAPVQPFNTKNYIQKAQQCRYVHITNIPVAVIFIRKCSL